MRVRSAVIVAVLVMAGSAQAQQFPQPKPPASPEAYIAENIKGLDAIEASIAGKTGKAPLFSANHYIAHGKIISGMSIEALKAYADGLAETGVRRIEFFTTQSAWPDEIPDDIAKYDVTIEHTRALGLEIGFDPTVDPVTLKGAKYDVWKPWAIAAYTEMARRYQPEKFSVLHEPIAMSARLREKVSAETWAAFTAEACAAVAAVSPKTECTVAVLPFEREVFEALIKVPAVTSVGFDIYSVGNEIKRTEEMIIAARAAGKSVHIAETWRPHWEGLATVGGDSNPFVPFNTGDRRYVALDQRWLETMVRFATALELDAIMPFCTSSFFKYMAPGPDASLTGTPLIRATEQAALEGERTATFRTYEKLIAEASR